jgi:RNA polymerase sigma-70 factor (ECF subfamily)
VQYDAIMILPLTETNNAIERNALQRAQSGDVEAFEELLRAFERQVLRVAARLTGNLEDGKDVAQEVFLKLHRELNRFREERELGPWLYRVTINACFDAKRKRKRSPLTSIGPESSMWRSGGPTPEEATRALEDQKLLEQGMQALTDRERAAIALRELEGLSTSEVAGILGSNESTVRVQISAARLKLRAFFGKVRGGKI